MKEFSQPFYFLRHGVTDYNQARLVMGQRDVPLNERGRDQARRAAQLLSNAGIAAILASPLERARETAGIVAAEVDLMVAVVEPLKERNWGVLEGHGHWEKPWLLTPDGGESLETFTQRVLAGFEAVRAAPAPALVVAHSGICRVLRRHLRIDDGEGPVPHAIPLRFEPLPGGAWREVTLEAPARRPARPRP